MNQRPSGYEPDELPGCSTPRVLAGRFCPPALLFWRPLAGGWLGRRMSRVTVWGRRLAGLGDFRAVLGGSGGDRLSRVLRRSTIGAEGFDGRVRNGIGFGPLAWATRPAKHSAARRAAVMSDQGPEDHSEPARLFTAVPLVFFSANRHRRPGLSGHWSLVTGSSMPVSDGH